MPETPAARVRFSRVTYIFLEVLYQRNERTFLKFLRSIQVSVIKRGAAKLRWAGGAQRFTVKLPPQHLISRQTHTQSQMMINCERFTYPQVGIVSDFMFVVIPVVICSTILTYIPNFLYIDLATPPSPLPLT